MVVQKSSCMSRTSDESGHEIRAIPGLTKLWQQTQGDNRICVAVLDGPVDLRHSSFRHLSATTVETVVPSVVDDGIASRHGTYIASLIFGGEDGPVRGLAPHCRGLFVPIFESRGSDALRPCSQLDLARAIAEAVRHGAQVINISGGEFSSAGSAGPLLTAAVQECLRHDVLIVTAAGNQGCACPHIPAALPSVLAVGAMNVRGEPLSITNWGKEYQHQGILAPGEDILGATSWTSAWPCAIKPRL